jgi:hypothetical protein
MKINWFKLFKPNVYLLEQELEYVKSLLAQTQKKLDDANIYILESKTQIRTINKSNNPYVKPVAFGWEAFQANHPLETESKDSNEVI